MAAVGQEIAGRYRLRRRLGGSEQTPVWLAVDREHDAAVVLKLQPANALARELTALRSLDHPALLIPTDAIQTADASCLVLPFAAAGDLGSQRGRPCSAWLGQLGQIAGALGYLHERGFVHGDVKPANMLVDATGMARLADFGNLRRSGEIRAATDSRSPYSSSPQQQAAQAADPADDVYGFGASAYELLCAHPPGYPVAGGAPMGDATGITPVHPAPAQLLELVRRCLSPDRAARPASMQAVATELAGVATQAAAVPAAVPILTPPESPANVLRPQWRRTGAAAAPDAEQLRRRGFRQGLIVAAGVALAAGAIALFMLPVRPPPATLPGSTPSPAAGAVVAQPAEAVDLQQLALQKSAAESLYARVAPRLKSLAESGAAEWDAAHLGSAGAALAAIDALMSRRDYLTARAQLQSLDVTVAQLEAGRKPALKAALQRGADALQKHDSAAAAAAYAAALRIDAADRDAQQGSRRAASLDAVLATVTRAREAEQAGRLAEAAAAWRQALSLDPLTSEAQAGLARTNTRMAADQFGLAMARGYAAIRAQQPAEARSAFEAARRMRPEDPEITRALAQVAAVETAGDLASTLAQARTAVAAEQWLEALRLYQKALALDATLVDVRKAQEEVGMRAALDHDLQQLISQPERLYTSTVRDAGGALLARARAIAAPGPLLSRQITQLGDLLRVAELPMSVVVRSDSLTEVTLYRVGELGKFAERSLQLTPGRYVLVGTRSGFRDVRRELSVVPGREPAPVDIHCVEPL